MLDVGQSGMVIIKRWVKLLQHLPSITYDKCSQGCVGIRISHNAQRTIVRMQTAPKAN